MILKLKIVVNKFKMIALDKQCGKATFYSLGSLASSAFFSVRCFFLASFDEEEDDVEAEAENPGA
jgi:hypothetical protein